LAEVTLRLFGTPRLDIDGEPARLGRRKATALLSYLAVTRSRHHRETLATLLWPESGPEAAYSALRNVLWILRQTPLADLLRTDRSTVELVEDESLWVDVHRFRDLTAGCPAREHSGAEACSDCVAALEEAVSLVEAPFMEGFMVSSADGFDDWQFAEREALQRELTETLDRTTAFYAEAEDWTAVTAHARRWLRADRLNEVCYRRLMRGLAALGRRSEALRCYEGCRRTLDEELGLSPEAATTELADLIRRADAEPRERPAVPRRTNLPAALTPFVGRTDVITRVTELLAEDEARLITLVGLGGIGKTSLALQIGRRLRGELPDGVFFIPLGTVDEAEVVASAIAEALGLSLSRDKVAHLALELEDYLREREILLILDEVEHIAPIGDLLAALLSAAPRARCLVTSRVPLNVGGETVVSLHGLEHPGEDVPIESLGEYDAIRLLKVAERQVDSAATTREPELRAMARIARLLEGFPLGLEMAGAWRGVFSWREIAERIASNLDFLVHTHRDVPARHRNLRAVYEQAWGLLSREERASLCRLAVFHGGFTIEAAERTTDSSPAVLASLAKRCLVRRVDSERYQVHELLRQFSSENLRVGSGDFESAVGRHAMYFIEFVEDSFERLKGPDQLATLRRLQRDLPNIRAAWLHAAKAGRAELLRRAAHGLFFYFDMRAHFEEGARVFHDAIRHFDGASDPVVDGFLRVAYGWFTRFTAEAEPHQWIGEGLSLLDDEEPFSPDHALANVIGLYAGAIPDIEEIRERLDKSLAHYRGAGDKWGEALAIDALAGAEFRVSAEEGERLAGESLRLRKEIGDHWGEALNLATLARFAEACGKLDLAKVRYHQSQRLSARIAEDLFMAIDAQLCRARIAGRLGAHDEGEELAEGGLRLARQASSRLLTARAMAELGRLARRKGELASAKERLEEAFSLLEGTPWRTDAACCAALLSQVAEESGDEGATRSWRQEALTLDPEGGRDRWAD
jgi:DNA-binding SARP family transcriptional activator/predicted ATPase